MLPDVAALSAEDASRAANAVAGLNLPSGARLIVADAVASVAEEAAAEIRRLATNTIAIRGRFRIALAGGSTPRALYPHLSTGVDWARTEVFFGDERAVPPDDAQSNYRMARETLLAPARVPDGNVHRWRAESTDLDAAAREYEQVLRASGPEPWLDLALLGLGPDGHTASLFPGTAALAEHDRLAVAVDVPAMKTHRLTLTYPAFLDATTVMFLVAGIDKRAALADVLRPDSKLPAARIIQRSGPVLIFCDREAARDINPPP
jgi:6-phosphogluconolactonase